MIRDATERARAMNAAMCRRAHEILGQTNLRWDATFPVTRPDLLDFLESDDRYRILSAERTLAEQELAMAAKR